METIYQTDSFNPGADSFSFNNHKYLYKTAGNSFVLLSRLQNTDDFNQQILDYIFQKYDCKKIVLDSITRSNPCTYKKALFVPHPVDSNFCLYLPDSLDEYMASLGKKTRQHLKWYQRQLDKFLLSQDIKSKYVCEKSHINKAVFENIVALNQERCLGKGFESGVDSGLLFKRLHENCVINYLEIDSKIVAGTIASVYNGALNLHVIAHSNSYGQFNIGNLILLKTIEYAITNDIHVFNFLWGNCEYKSRFGAKEQKFYNIEIYRTFIPYLIRCSKYGGGYLQKS